jgi:magnesium-transporting ATPase (P-type)
MPRRQVALVFTKGAPDILLTRCTHELVCEERRQLSDTRRRQILDANDVLATAIGLEPSDQVLVLPLLATQLLWINLVTDGAPAVALGLEPADPSLMRLPPRPAGEGVITRRMWARIFFVGAVMAVGTLYVLDAALPGGFVSGAGNLRYGRRWRSRR